MGTKYKLPLKSDGDYLELLPPFIIRFIYYLYNYRLLYYLPMERMSKTIEISVYYLQELRNENKNLKEKISELEDVSEDYDLLSKDFITLGEENKNLNIKVASLEWEIKWLNYTIDKLHKEIEEQEAEWGWLFDEIDYRKREAKRLWWKPNK